mgnify:CR=1 FL=1
MCNAAAVENENALSRRRFLQAGTFVASLALPTWVRAELSKLSAPVKIGLIADLHHYVIHDGPQRLAAFLEAMEQEQPDAIMQLGDFAYPSAENEPVTSAFANAHPRSLHVLGNHDVDDGHSFEEVVRLWKMKGRYYTQDVGGLELIVLDGNEKPPGHQSGYPAHIGPEQLAWLEATLQRLTGPAVVVSHQPLAGPASVDNAPQVQDVLNTAADKILLAVNGHTHIDHVVRSGKIMCLHVNSASYYWVGGSYRHASYPGPIHAAHPYIEYTCPYSDPLFTTLTINPGAGRIDVQGRRSVWVGKSPAELGRDSNPVLTDGEEIVPQIRARSLHPAPA